MKATTTAGRFIAEGRHDGKIARDFARVECNADAITTESKATYGATRWRLSTNGGKWPRYSLDPTSLSWQCNIPFLHFLLPILYFIYRTFHQILYLCCYFLKDYIYFVTKIKILQIFSHCKSYIWEVIKKLYTKS